MPKLFYKDLWGKREDKYRFLETNDVATVDWKELTLTEPYYFFVPKDFSLKEEHEGFWSVKNIFIQFSSGVKTHRDHFIVGFTRQEVANKMRIFTGTLDDETVKESLKLKDTRDWKLSDARTKLKAVHWKDLIIPYAYRAFDQRYICYCTDLIDRGCARYDLMKNFFGGNLGLTTTRRMPEVFSVSAFICSNVSDIHLIGDQNYFFPLYLYPFSHAELVSASKETLKQACPEEILKQVQNDTFRVQGDKLIHMQTSQRMPNFKPEFLTAIRDSLGYEPVPEEIFYYIYAVLYSPTYRARYQEFLKIDLPRIPLPENQKTFKMLSNLGKRLVDLHLLKSEISNLQSAITVGYPVTGSDKVERVKYQNGKVYINKEQYFDNVPEDVWNYHIGSYQVLEKFLKDRKGKPLSLEEKQKYFKIILAIALTIEIQKEIDRIWQI
ncbi:MAG: hypothetical protein QMC83_03130 [Thermodesulfovibrionales bacterium]|nr:hypothetical protein [Thermodesulfovibrionales bacterium]